MCTKSGIVPALMILAILFVFTGAILVILGFVLMGHENAGIAFENENVGLGFLCFFIGGGIIPLGFVGTYGARSHNKFCLTVYVGACVVIVFFLWAIGSGVSGLGDLDRKYPEALQIDCNRMVQTGIGTPELCKEYYDNVKMVRIKKLWNKLHDQSKGSPSVKSLLTTMQKGSLNERGVACCGFSRPTYCNKEWHDCGMPAGYYASTSYCTITDDTYKKKTKDEESPTGCPFENPVGVCALSPLDDEDAGCGFTLLVWIDSEMKNLGGIISTISIVPIIGSLFACCMCFKRKHADVLPTKYVQTMGQ